MAVNRRELLPFAGWPGTISRRVCMSSEAPTLDGMVGSDRGDVSGT